MSAEAINEAGPRGSHPTVVALCRDLIANPSENPPGDESVVAGTVSSLLSEWGFEVTRHEALATRPNVVGRLRRGNGRRLILQAHTDTKPAVTPGQESRWTVDPFRGTEREGLLYGLGACDTKGGLAAQLAAARALAARRDWSGELIVQAVADEEDGSKLGAEHLLGLGLLDAEGAVVAEPTNCRPSLAQLGNAWAEIVILGRATHAGTPERKQDAFRAALRYVATVDDLLQSTDPDPNFPSHPRLNVGDFAMPGHPGTVPGECRLRCDIRVLPGHEREATIAVFQRAADVLRRDTDVNVTVRLYQGGGCQSHRIHPDEGIAQAFRHAQQATGGPLGDPAFAGGTDARYFAMAGTPAIVYGPGNLAQAHAPDEFVAVAELNLAERQLSIAALAFLQDDSSAEEAVTG